MAIAALTPANLSAEQRFVGNEVLSSRKEAVDVSNAWHVTDSGLARLRSYVLRGEIDIYMKTKVRVLKLDGTQVGDAALKHLEGKDGLTGLSQLSLANTRVSDEGLKSLVGLKGLRRVNLGRSLVFPGGVSGVRVTMEGFARLQKALPDCLVEHRRIPIELTASQRATYQLWSPVALVRLNESGDTISLFIRRAAKLSAAHRNSLKSLTQLEELYAAGSLSSGDLGLLHPLENLTRLCLRDCAIDDRAVAQLAGLSRLSVLDLAGTQLTDRGLRQLHPLKRLVAIDMRGTGVATEGLQQLRKALPKTEFAIDPWRVVRLPYRRLALNDRYELADVGSIGYRKPHDQLVQELTQLLQHPSLERIDLRHTQLADDDLKIIARMSKLKVLDIGNTKITSAGVKHLAQLENLEKMNLWHTRISGDGGLSALEMLPKLRSLELDETRIDDRALESLGRMKSLRYTELWHTGVTKAGVARLQSQRADLQIKSNPRK